MVYVYETWGMVFAEMCVCVCWAIIISCIGNIPYLCPGLLKEGSFISIYGYQKNLTVRLEGVNFREIACTHLCVDPLLTKVAVLDSFPIFTYKIVHNCLINLSLRHCMLVLVSVKFWIAVVIW